MAPQIPPFRNRPFPTVTSHTAARPKSRDGMAHVSEFQFGGAILSHQGRGWEGCALIRISERVARSLQREGVASGARVAIAVAEPALFLAAVGAVRSLGAV